MDTLKNTELTIDFTYELENNNLTFWDILLINRKNKLESKVYHKSTYKNDHVHFHSHHKTKTKKEIIIGF